MWVTPSEPATAFSSTRRGSSSVQKVASPTDQFSSSWLDQFKTQFGADWVGVIRGLPRTEVKTSLVSNTEGGGTFSSFGSALTRYLNNGGTGSVFYDPVMHYDLSSMKDKFEVVNKEAGIYKKDGVLYAKKDLGGSDVLQPIGIQKTAEGNYEAVGTSTDLDDDQAKALEGILTALKETEGNLEGAIIKASETAASEEEESSSSESSSETAPPAAGKTHSGPK